MINTNAKTALCRLLRLGLVPKRLQSVFEEEGIIVFDEGVCGRLVTKNVDGPGKRYRCRSEWFCGFLVVTRLHVVCYTFRKRQINISVNDNKIKNLYVCRANIQELHLSFESSDYRDGWQGVIEFRFYTEKALQFCDALLGIGVKKGTAPGRDVANTS